MIYGNTLGKMTNKLTDSQNSCLLESYYWLYTAHYVCVTSWSFSCSTSIMSPGSVLGDWSASPLNVIFCPCFIPLSTCTSKTFTSLLTLRPSHSLQRSFSWITSPKNATKHWNVVLRPSQSEFTEWKWILTLSIAVSAHRLHLLYHARSQLSDHDPHATAPTRGTLLHGPRFTPLTEEKG